MARPKKPVDIRICARPGCGTVLFRQKRYCSRACCDEDKKNPLAAKVWEMRRADSGITVYEIARRLEVTPGVAGNALYRRKDIPGDVQVKRQAKKEPPPVIPKKDDYPQIVDGKRVWGKHVAPRELWNADELEKQNKEILERKRKR